MDLDKIARKMDRLKNDTLYTLTVCPADNHQWGKGGRWACVRESVMNVISPHIQDIDQLVLYPDISFPTALTSGVYPRIHFHGWISFKNIINVLTKWEPRSHHRIEIDTINDIKLWKAYCKKFIAIHSTYNMYRIEKSHMIEYTQPANRTRNIVDLCREYNSSTSSDSSSSEDEREEEDGR